MLYDNMFTIENVSDMPEGKTYEDYFNPNSVIELNGAKIEPALADAKAGDKFQFVRLGYFAVDSKDHARFNRIVELKGPKI
jgi:glutaminyl-tRNA synthetase